MFVRESEFIWICFYNCYSNYRLRLKPFDKFYFFFHASFLYISKAYTLLGGTGRCLLRLALTLPFLVCLCESDFTLISFLLRSIPFVIVALFQSFVSRKMFHSVSYKTRMKSFSGLRVQWNVEGSGNGTVCVSDVEVCFMTSGEIKSGQKLSL